MIPTQDARTSASPVADVRDGATSRTVAGLAAPPVTSPARSTTQTCTRCLRSGAIKVTVCLGDRRWRFCQWCVSRGDKTTTLATVTCAHPYSQSSIDGGYVCITCYEPVPGPARCADDDQHAAECGLCAEAGRASVATVLSLGLFGTVLVSIAGATGKLGWLDRLPLPHPAPNGLSLLVVLVLAAGVLWWTTRAETSPHEKLEKWPAGAEPLADATWPDLDPDEARPMLLPIDERQVRS